MDNSIIASLEKYVAGVEEKIKDQQKEIENYKTLIDLLQKALEKTNYGAGRLIKKARVKKSP